MPEKQHHLRPFRPLIPEPPRIPIRADEYLISQSTNVKSHGTEFTGRAAGAGGTTGCPPRVRIEPAGFARTGGRCCLENVSQPSPPPSSEVRAGRLGEVPASRFSLAEGAVPTRSICSILEPTAPYLHGFAAPLQP